MIGKLFSEEPIQPFQDLSVKETKLLKSPGGAVLARIFSVNLDTTVPARVYPISKRRQIIEQMRLVLQDFYVHLEMKQAQYGFNSLRALARLEPVLAEISDVEFFQSVIQVITRTRDRHLAFSAYQPNGTKAILPFNIERCWINGVETYVVTRIWGESEAQHLKEGAIVTHWNGVPINRHIRLNANYFDGGNEPASLARSLEFLTVRPLDQFALPIESWVVLRFLVEDQPYEERFDWLGFDIGQVPSTPAIGRNVVGFGGDLEIIQSHMAKRTLFAPQSFDGFLEEVLGSEELGLPKIKGKTDNFAFGDVTTER
mgnify:FL=1